MVCFMEEAPLICPSMSSTSLFVHVVCYQAYHSLAKGVLASHLAIVSRGYAVVISQHPENAKEMKCCCLSC